MTLQSVRFEAEAFRLRAVRLSVIVFLLALCLLLLPAFPARAFAATDGWTASGTCEWRVDDEGCLTVRPADGVSGTLEDWGFDAAPWSGVASQIISARFEGSVSAVTARSMFADCSNMESVDFSGLDTSSATDMSRMFRNCSALESLDLSGLDTSSVTDMLYMFHGCSSLESLDLSGLDTSKVMDMRWMFDGCSSLASLDLSGWDTSSTEYMGRMFDGCSALRSVTLGGGLLLQGFSFL